VIAVFENIMSFWLELTSLKRRTVAVINIALVFLLSLPCILGFGVLSEVKIFGLGIMDLEDYVVSNLLLPIGSIIYVLFCTSRYGWGWDKFIAEANCGSKGINMPRILKPYVSYVLPVIIAAVFVMSII
ncbi:MAG: sodium-dependent transporter, partial [Clostridia bacterium]|nr:sodium-dependent transporter [Clostridia bacterium]